TGIGVDTILYTCSAFGEAIDAVARATPMPVLKPNEAMFAEALHLGTHIGLLATFQPSIPALEQEFVDPGKGPAYTRYSGVGVCPCGHGSLDGWRRRPARSSHCCSGTTPSPLRR